MPETQTVPGTVATASPVPPSESAPTPSPQPETTPPPVASAPDTTPKPEPASQPAPEALKPEEAQALKDKAAIYDALAGDQEFVSYWKSREEKKKSEAEPKAFSLSPDEYADVMSDPQKFTGLLDRYYEFKSAGDKKALQEATRKLQVSEAAEIINVYADAQDEEGKPIHPRFNELSDMGLVNFFLTQDPPKVSSEWNAKLDKAYKAAEKLYGEIHTAGKNEALGIVQKKVQTSTQTPTATSSQVFAGDPTKMTAKEAVDLARRGISVSR